MKTELFYFDDCPSWQQALENSKRALELEQLPDEVEMIQVADPADAQAKRFIGSPTIRVDEHRSQTGCPARGSFRYL